MNLFQSGNYILNSGAESKWKIECDALTDGDWYTLAVMAKELVPPFGSVVGVPTGGNKFARAMQQYVTPRAGNHLIVDDVLTTGGSMNRLRDEYVLSQDKGKGVEAWVQGVVVFARGRCPGWVRAVFQMPEELWVNKIVRGNQV